MVCLDTCTSLNAYLLLQHLLLWIIINCEFGMIWEDAMKSGQREKAMPYMFCVFIRCKWKWTTIEQWYNAEQVWQYEVQSVRPDWAKTSKR